MDSTVATPDSRKAALARAVQAEVAAGGIVESQTDYSAVIRYQKKVNHTLHLILTVLTLTVWSWVWLGLAIYAATQRKVITINVDEYGQVLRQKVR